MFHMRKCVGKIISWYWFILTFTVIMGRLEAQQIAFPGAEGFGKYASGGRGGDVVAVTNLMDDPDDPPEGSMRWAIRQAIDTLTHPLGFTYTKPRPLTIVFRVSGIIELKDELDIHRSNLTIAGQTAPGDGICFKKHTVSVSGGGSAGIQSNIIVRYLRFRPGIDADSAELARGIAGLDVENCRNVIVDHCSFSWANEECAIFYDNHTTTIQWCIAGEGLYNAGHAKGSRSYCGVWGGQYTSIHHNLIAHNRSRTIRFNGARAHDTAAVVDYRNNVIYNWRDAGACYGGEVEIWSGYSRANIISNYYKPGPATSTTHLFIKPSYKSQNWGVGEWHLSGNVMEGDYDLTGDNWQGVDFSNIPSSLRDTAKSMVPFNMDVRLPTESADEAFLSVLDRAGAVYPGRDTVDARIVYEARTGTTSSTGTLGNGIIDDPEAVGGYPEYNTSNVPEDLDEDGMDDAWELENGLDPSDHDDRNLVDTSGYTKLEVYLNELVEEFTLILPPVVSSEERYAKPEIIVYPNPVRENVHVISKNPVSVVYVYDLSGSVIREMKGENTKIIEMKDLKQGVYFIQVFTNKGFSVDKVIKM